MKKNKKIVTANLGKYMTTYEHIYFSIFKTIGFFEHHSFWQQMFIAICLKRVKK